ncbi:hypothetical protein [Desulfogranum marinum]|uniref:hypothetical protein n=1 Tax=Desulfogranum marinum TaxID=453220 RepID=UPI0029C78795|nr:hypothetical protein [Desulfogranum marinum]
MSKRIWFDNQVRRSSAYRSLSKWAMLVYLDFLSKRQMEQMKGRSGRSDSWIIKNNGEIVYPYSEAERKGISRRNFCNAIDELIGQGFLDIAHQGSGGRAGDMTKYIIDDRWKEYGTLDFRPPKNPRKKDTRKGRGWAAHHAKKKKRQVTKSIPEQAVSSDKNDTPKRKSVKVSNNKSDTPKRREKKANGSNHEDNQSRGQLSLWSNDFDTIL